MATVLVPHNSNWRIAYHRAQVAVRNALGTTLLQMHHIGGTAMPSVPARPIIDMLGVVASLDAVDLRGGALAAVGYVTRAAPEAGIDRFYNCETCEPATTLRLFQFGSAHIGAYLALTERVRTDAPFAAAFAARKRAAADQAIDFEAYRQALFGADSG
jgi:GrpB-like predicted nucleotidyltransferase (UPF0157 family)